MNTAQAPATNRLRIRRTRMVVVPVQPNHPIDTRITQTTTYPPCTLNPANQFRTPSGLPRPTDRAQPRAMWTTAKNPRRLWQIPPTDARADKACFTKGRPCLNRPSISFVSSGHPMIVLEGVVPPPAPAHRVFRERLT